MSTSKAQVPLFDFDYCKDKKKVFENYCKYTFTKTQSMFVYKGLPESIPAQWLEKYLQQNGSCIIAKVNGDLYALSGNVAGERDAYYQPTQYIVANPWLKLSKTFDIGKDCVYCRNDYEALGLIPLVSRYCGLMTENLLTVRTTDVNLRMMNLLSAVDQDTVKSAKKYLEDLELGKVGVIAEDGFWEGIKVQGNNAGHSDYMIQFVELQQYIKGSLYNELGINANFNMKRESINGDEAALNDDALMPLIDDMLKHRRIMCDEINEMFDLDVSVDYGSSWHANVAEKAAFGDEELNASPEEAAAMGGDEQTLPNDTDPQGGEDVSRLNDSEEADGEESDKEQLNDVQQDSGESSRTGGESDDSEGNVDRETFSSQEMGDKESEEGELNGDRSEEERDSNTEIAEGQESEESDANSQTDGQTETVEEDQPGGRDLSEEDVPAVQSEGEGNEVNVEVDVNVEVGTDDNSSEDKNSDNENKDESSDEEDDKDVSQLTEDNEEDNDDEET